MSTLQEEKEEEFKPRGNKDRKNPKVEESESNYDDEYDDTLDEDLNNVDVESVSSFRESWALSLLRKILMRKLYEKAFLKKL